MSTECIAAKEENCAVCRLCRELGAPPGGGLAPTGQHFATTKINRPRNEKQRH
jgi:hypothetical protein